MSCDAATEAMRGANWSQSPDWKDAAASKFMWPFPRDQGLMILCHWFIYWAASQYYVRRCISLLLQTSSLSVGLSVTIVSLAKTAEPIEMPFGLRTRAGPKNHVLGGVQIPVGRIRFKGKGAARCKV